jgi:hypothetical protein
MGSALIDGADIVKLAERFGWADVGGTKHPFLLKKSGKRPVPVRNKLQNPNEIRAILKQLEIPRADWPAVVA